MAPKGIKASKLFERKSKAKVVDWRAWEHYRGTSYIPVEVGTSTSQQSPGRDAATLAVRMDIVNQVAGLHDTDPESMDVNEPLQMEEDIPEQR
jgi:hypothetical protein